MLLTGCFGNQPEPRIEYRDRITEVKVTVPKELLVCPDFAVDPSSINKQSDVASLLNDLYYTHSICVTNMNTLKQRIE